MAYKELLAVVTYGQVQKWLSRASAIYSSNASLRYVYDDMQNIGLMHTSENNSAQRCHQQLLGSLLCRYPVVLERMTLKDLMQKQPDEVITCDPSGCMVSSRGVSSRSGCVQSTSSVNIDKSANILSNASASGFRESDVEIPRKRRKTGGQS